MSSGTKPKTFYLNQQRFNTKDSRRSNTKLTLRISVVLTKDRRSNTKDFHRSNCSCSGDCSAFEILMINFIAKG